MAVAVWVAIGVSSVGADVVSRETSSLVLLFVGLASAASARSATTGDTDSEPARVPRETSSRVTVAKSFTQGSSDHATHLAARRVGRARQPRPGHRHRGAPYL